MDSEAIVVFITVPSAEAGKTIAKALLENRTAACVNILGPIQSHYWWENEIQEDEEFLLIVKTQAALFESRLIPQVKAVHPYEVPEIIALPITSGSESYLKWIKESTAE